MQWLTGQLSRQFVVKHCPIRQIRYDTIRYDTVDLGAIKSWRDGQLNLAHGPWRESVPQYRIWLVYTQKKISPIFKFNPDYFVPGRWASLANSMSVRLSVCPLAYINKSSTRAEISDRVELHWKCLFTPRRPVVTKGDSFWGRVALKLVVTTLVCVKLVINLWRFAPPEKSYLQEGVGITLWSGIPGR